MLTIYRRHSEKCSGKYHEKPNPQDFTKCRCPIYKYGTVDGKEIRRSMKTRDWGRAEKQIKKDEEQEDGGTATVKTVADAIEGFVIDGEGRKLSRLTMKDYRRTLRYFAGFVGEKLPVETALSLDRLSRFRAQLTGKRGKPLTSRGGAKVVKHLRLFNAFCIDNGWVGKNVATKLKPPKDDGSCTLPYDGEETAAIIAATDGPYERALIYTLLFTGFRISEVAHLRRADVSRQDGKTIIDIQKTRKTQYMKVHPLLGQALALVPGDSTYFFWNGQSETKSCTWRLRVMIGRICERAEVNGGRPHRFRDTFAVELLTNGVDIRTVQLLLGHSSVTTTERHYAPWVKAFQARLDAAVLTLSYGEPSSSHIPPAVRTSVSVMSGSRAS